MNILRFSNRSGLVKLKEHQMQDKITDFFGRYCQFFYLPCLSQSEFRLISINNLAVVQGLSTCYARKEDFGHKKSPS